MIMKKSYEELHQVMHEQIKHLDHEQLNDALIVVLIEEVAKIKIYLSICIGIIISHTITFLTYIYFFK